MSQTQTLSPIDRLIVVVVVMSSTLMQVIDTTIVNVALPHMQGALNASPDEITWTLTSYLVSSAIFMPLTGFLTDRLGRRRYLFICILGFTSASILCGMSTSLMEIVAFRLLQGVFGAGFVPLSQAVMTDIFPASERGKAMALWGMGVMVGPVIGPTLGGYLTEAFNWRWTFYVNVPVGLITMLLIRFVPDTEKKPRHMDWLGLLLISLSIGSMQYVLDRGNHDDWLNSPLILGLSVLSILSVITFVYYSRRQAAPVFDFAIFKDRNFTISCLMLAVFGLGLYGTMVIQPMMMENLLQYPVLTTGFILAPRGLAAMCSMMVVGKWINRIDPRYWIFLGVLFTAFGMSVGRYYSLDVNIFWMVWPMIFQGLGLGMIFVPLSIIAYSTLEPRLRIEAAGIYSLLRTLGGSMGISIAITVFSQRSQYFWNQLSSSITPYNPAVYRYLQAFHLRPEDPMGSALLTHELQRQSTILAVVNVFDFITWAFLLMLPLLFLFRRREN